MLNKKTVIDQRICLSNDGKVNLRQMKILEDLGLGQRQVAGDPVRRERVEKARQALANNPRENNLVQLSFVSFLHDAIVKSDELAKMLSSELRGKAVVDLGCGSSEAVKESLDLVEKLGAGAYIGVDVFYRKNEFPVYAYSEKRVKIAMVGDDMLLFAASLKDKSVNFIISGIDNCIINEGWYWKELNAHIKRATEDGGIILENSSKNVRCNAFNWNETCRKNAFVGKKKI